MPDTRLTWNERVANLAEALGRKPTLAELLDLASMYEMTDEEKRAQRRSWVVGEMLIEHPDMTREEAERHVDRAMREDDDGR